MWRDAKETGTQISAQDLDVLKILASKVVADPEKAPMFKNAAGSWKLGHACIMMVGQRGKGSVANVPTLAQDMVETLVQTALASMVTYS